MNRKQRAELIAIIDAHSDQEGVNETAVPGLTLFKSTTTDMRMPTLYNPSICLVVQGSKQTMLQKDVYRFGPAEYVMTSVNLPVIGQVVEASMDRPYLCIKIDIDVQQLSELLLHIDNPQPTNTEVERGLFIASADATVSESVLRFARLLDTPKDIPVLAPMMIREIYYRLLCSDCGGRITRIALKDSHMQRIANAILKIKADFHKKITVEELSTLAGMSVSSFHAHFKAVTAMSPLQFQKSLRLIEARNLMISGEMDAASTAYQVGYESPSQFSREYTRMFNNPPRRDISLFKQRGFTPQLTSSSTY